MRKNTLMSSKRILIKHMLDITQVTSSNQPKLLLTEVMELDSVWVMWISIQTVMVRKALKKMLRKDLMKILHYALIQLHIHDNDL
jgi:hypothetical protein